MTYYASDYVALPPIITQPRMNRILADFWAMVEGFTPAGTFVSPYNFVISTDGTNYYASNSYQTIYGGPTDVGGVDGGSCRLVLEAAIATLTNGGLINFGQGTFEIDVTAGTDLEVILQKSNIAIVGAGIDATILKAVGTLPALGKYLFKLEDNCILSNLTIDMNYNALTFTAPVPNSWYGGVLLGDYNYTTPTDLPATNSLVDNIKVINCKTPGGVANIQGCGLNLLHGYGIKVRDVYFYNDNVGLFLTYQPTSAIILDGFANNMYNVNGVYGDSNYILVYWEIGSANLTNVRGKDNTLGVRVNATAGGFKTYGKISNVYLENTIEGGIVFVGIPEWFQMDNITIEGTDAGYHGIYLFGAVNTPYTLTNIHIKNVGHTGIYQLGLGKIEIDGADIRGCGAYGIFGSGDFTITNATVEDSVLNGIHLGSDDQTNRIIITGCRTINNGVDGIYLDEEIHAVVTNNVSTLNGSQGIVCAGVTSDYNIVMCNSADGNTNVVDIVCAGVNNKLYANMGAYTPQNIGT